MWGRWPCLPSSASISGTSCRPPIAIEPAATAGWSAGHAARIRLLPSASSICLKNRSLRDLPAPRRRPQGHHPLDRRRAKSRSLNSKSIAPAANRAQSEPASPISPRGWTPTAPASWKPPASSTANSAPVTLLRHAGDAERTVLPRLHQTSRRAQSADLRLVVPGRRMAGPTRRDRLHSEPADPARPPETTRNWLNCSPAPNSSGAAAPLGANSRVDRLGDTARKSASARRALSPPSRPQ